ncbi:MAG: ferrochelatase, partial [Actinomycetota bacterium]|nr:ferrochelatase [Actinomycetota bacterium]
MAYGTPATAHDVEAYYTHVRRGRPPTPELLADLRRRYEAIGGTSPLLHRTRAQAAGLGAALGPRFRVELGMKHASPFIEEGVARLAEAGVGRVIGLVLAPHYSRLSVGEYAARAHEAAAAHGLDLDMVESWHLEPAYIDLLADFVMEASEVPQVEVVFTAHSLPARILDEGDPYPDQLRETAAAVVDRAGVKRWSVAWQSAGRTPDPWIGPDILDVLRARAAEGVGAVVVCPAGFVSDHLEVLYDLDVEARAVARDVGLAFARTRMPNDDPRFCGAIAEVV